MELKKLIDGFGAANGIIGLRPDEDGVYSMSVDDMVVSVMEVAEGGRLVIWSVVGELPPEGRERLYRVMLEAMFAGQATGGCVFSIAPETGTVVLQRSEFLAAIDDTVFAGLLETFVNALEDWRKFVAGFRDATPELEAAQRQGDDELRRLGLGMDGFLKG